jgi:hypothetical protein
MTAWYLSHLMTVCAKEKQQASMSPEFGSEENHADED